jgi:hypothetical protein
VKSPLNQKYQPSLLLSLRNPLSQRCPLSLQQNLKNLLFLISQPSQSSQLILLAIKMMIMTASLQATETAKHQEGTMKVIQVVKMTVIPPVISTLPPMKARPLPLLVRSLLTPQPLLKKKLPHLRKKRLQYLRMKRLLFLRRLQRPQRRKLTKHPQM